MKEHTSKFLKSIAYLYLAFPVSYLVYAALIFDIPFERTTRMLFTFSFWGLSATGMLAGYALKEMTRWSWNAFLLNSLFVAYANALIVAKYSASQNKLLAFLVSIVLLVGLIFRLGKEIKVPYFLPKIRWWENNPRYKLVVPVKVERTASGFEGEILDVSMGGCFVKTRIDMNQNERILARFTIFGESMEIGGTVVWRTQSSVTHPKGVGVKFDALDKTQKKVLKAATHHLKKISSAQNARERMSQEEFSKRMESLRAHRLNITTKSQEEQAS